MLKKLLFILSAIIKEWESLEGFGKKVLEHKRNQDRSGHECFSKNLLKNQIIVQAGDCRMAEKDYALFENIHVNAAKISEKWFDTRKEKGGIYAKDADATVQKELKKQHIFTIKTIASGFLKDKEEFQKNLHQWTKIVVHSRLKWDTPIYEVVEAINKTRNLVWEFITEYSLVHEEVGKHDVLRWSAIYHPILDKLISEFSEQYYMLTRKRLKGQEELIEEIHLPIIPVSESIGVLPLIGVINETRAKSLSEMLPVKCAQKQITALVVDLSGVNYIDTFVANQLFQVTQALKLLGVQTILSGIRPEVAQTAIHLGLEFHQFQTFHSLKQALAFLGISKCEKKSGL